jgi:hypothetical protein
MTVPERSVRSGLSAGSVLSEVALATSVGKTVPERRVRGGLSAVSGLSGSMGVGRWAVGPVGWFKLDRCILEHNVPLILSCFIKTTDGRLKGAHSKRDEVNTAPKIAFQRI